MAEATLDSVKETAKEQKLVGYVCKVKCFWNNILYNAGDTVYIPAGTKTPEWFEKAK